MTGELRATLASFEMLVVRAREAAILGRPTLPIGDHAAGASDDRENASDRYRQTAPREGVKIGRR
jgi:hypothetical protein